MAEQEEAAPAAEEPGIPAELEIPFTYPVGDSTEIRKMWAKMPRPEQLLVWQRTIDTLTKAPVTAAWTGSEVMAALERLRRIIDSLLVNRADIVWLDDMFLSGDLDFKKLAPLVLDITTAFQEAAAATGNREQRRAVAKETKKAKRKAAVQ